MVEVQEPSDLVIRFEFERGGYPARIRPLHGPRPRLRPHRLRPHPAHRRRPRPARSSPSLRDLGGGGYEDQLIGPRTPTASASRKPICPPTSPRQGHLPALRKVTLAPSRHPPYPSGVTSTSTPTRCFPPPAITLDHAPAAKTDDSHRPTPARVARSRWSRNDPAHGLRARPPRGLTPSRAPPAAVEKARSPSGLAEGDLGAEPPSTPAA